MMKLTVYHDAINSAYHDGTNARGNRTSTTYLGENLIVEVKERGLLIVTGYNGKNVASFALGRWVHTELVYED